jgi:1-acyl-sn-glycerol-3-phosphate acyltransferase
MSYITKNTFYFKKNVIHDKIGFNKKIYNALNESNCRNLIIYPEGLRRREDTLFSIKKGATHIAWTYNMCIQIIITKNKEHIINLQALTSQYGVNLYCYRSEVINPEYFSSFEEFNSYVTVIWEDSWKKMYECREIDFIYKPLTVKPYNVKYSKTFFILYNILPLLILLYISFSVI